jgi:hypothetical protein
MADIRATKNGNWSDATVWTPNPPAAGDVVRPNNFTVTIDVSVSVTEIRNDAGGGAVANGGFVVNDGISVTATNGFFLAPTNSNATNTLLTYNGTTSITLNGQLNSIVGSTVFCLNNTNIGLVTINGNLNQAGGGAGRVVRNSSTGTVTVIGNLTGSAAGSVIDNVSTGTINVTGNISSGTTTGINNLSSGTIVVNGNLTSSGTILITNTSGTVTVTGNSTCNAVGALNGRCITNDSGTITVIGDIITSSAGNNQGHINILNSGSGIVNIIGTVFGAGATGNVGNRCIQNSSNGTINITGVVNGIAVVGTLASGLVGVATIFNGGTGTINVTGTVNNGVFTNTLQTFSTIFNQGGTVNINGNVQGGDSISINNYTNTSTTTINGNVIGGGTRVSVINFVNGTVNLNGNAIGGTSFFAIEGVSSAGNTIIERAVYSNLGQSPITGYIKFKTTNPEIDVLREDSVIVTLRDPLNVSGLLPATSDVRSGTTYNTGSSTGTLAIPAANLVQLGVPVDNTVGTGNLTPADFWNYLISNGFATSSIGERLKNASTVDTTGAQVAGFII